MESEEIMDSQLSAYSIHAKFRHPPWHGRLNYAESHNYPIWASNDNTAQTFWKIDLILQHRVTAIATQGRGDVEQFVTAFQVSHSNDSFSWNYIQATDNTNKVFFFYLHKCFNFL